MVGQGFCSEGSCLIQCIMTCTVDYLYLGTVPLNKTSNPLGRNLDASASSICSGTPSMVSEQLHLAVIQKDVRARRFLNCVANWQSSMEGGTSSRNPQDPQDRFLNKQCSPRFASGGPPTPQGFLGSVLVRWWNLSSHATGQLTQTKMTL